MTAAPQPQSSPQANALLDEDYDSAEDSDFDPTTSAPQAASPPSSDDDDDISGDEATKSKSKSKVKKRKRPRIEDEEGGEGGLIKTRRQRAKEIHEKAGGVAAGKVTTDVDKLWAEMNAAPARSSPRARSPGNDNGTAESPKIPDTPSVKAKGESKEEILREELSATGERMVRIKRTYDFAGDTITEEALVPASSRTAASNTAPAPTGTGRRAPPKKRTSAFDKPGPAKKQAALKINTLEKSRLDWAGYVDREGIGDDLQKWNKGDKGYLERQAFLGRVEERGDAQRRGKD